MDRATTKQLATMPIEFKLNGDTVIGRPDETIIECAKRHGVEIPHLCYKPGLRPDGNCRACVVEVKGERALAPSRLLEFLVAWAESRWVGNDAARARASLFAKQLDAAAAAEASALIDAIDRRQLAGKLRQ